MAAHHEINLIRGDIFNDFLFKASDTMIEGRALTEGVTHIDFVHNHTVTGGAFTQPRPGVVIVL